MEIVCGALVLLGLATRLAVLPLLAIMGVAIGSTKISILMESGFWKMAHAARNDFAISLGALFLLIVGPGKWALDRRWHAPASRPTDESEPNWRRSIGGETNAMERIPRLEMADRR